MMAQGIQQRTMVLVEGREYFASLRAPAYQGGMSLLYEAEDAYGRQWILRVPKMAGQLSPPQAEQASRQFAREGEILKSLSHAGVIWCAGYEKRGQDQFMVLERLVGSFEGRQGDVWPDEAIDVGVQVAAALEHLAKQDICIIHRDIKPSNLLFDKNLRVRLADFGIARFYDESDPSRDDTMTYSTAGYAPPEQEWRYGQTGPDSDVYSLGVTLQMLLAGGPARGVAPQRGHWIERTPDDLLNEIVEPQKRQESRELAEVLAKAMRYDRTSRYQTATDFRLALEGVASQRGWSLMRPFRTCPYYGHQTQLHANFCGSCGGRLNRLAPDPYGKLAQQGLLFGQQRA